MSRNNFFLLVKSIPSLIKYKLTASVAFTTFVGYYYYSNSIDLILLYTIIGIYFVAAGASALNQVLEHRYDKLMDRTKNRPIPSEKIKPSWAILISVFFISIGTSVLILKSGTIPAILGFFNVIWYCGVYTLLKRKTVFAIIPGSLVGAIPPIIGWIAAGGNVTEIPILLIAFFLFMWQIPHFWLLAIKYQDDYNKAGHPSITDSISLNIIIKISFVWICSLVIASLFFVYFEMIQKNLIIYLLYLLNGILLCIYIINNFISKTFLFRLTFISINSYMILVLILLLIDMYLR